MKTLSCDIDGTVISRGSKNYLKYIERYHQYLKTPRNDISSVYKRPSEVKRRIWIAIYKYAYNIYYLSNPKILSHNSNFFSVGWVADCNHRFWFVFETHANRYIVPITDENYTFYAETKNI